MVLRPLLWAVAKGKWGHTCHSRPWPGRPAAGSSSASGSCSLCPSIVSSGRLYRTGLCELQQRNQIYSAFLRIFSRDVGGGGQSLAHPSCSFCRESQRQAEHQLTWSTGWLKERASLSGPKAGPSARTLLLGVWRCKGRNQT